MKKRNKWREEIGELEVELDGWMDGEPIVNTFVVTSV